MTGKTESSCPDQKCHDRVTRLTTIIAICSAMVSLIVIIAIAWVNITSASNVRRVQKVDSKIENTQERLNAHEKQMQVYSIKQDVMIKQLEKVEKTVNEMQKDRNEFIDILRGIKKHIDRD